MNLANYIDDDCHWLKFQKGKKRKSRAKLSKHASPGDASGKASSKVGWFKSDIIVYCIMPQKLQVLQRKWEC